MRYKDGYLDIYRTKDKSRNHELYRIFLLLVENGADLKNCESAKSYGIAYPNRILYGVIEQENIEILKYLIEEKNFDVDAILYEGNTPLMRFVEIENKEIIKYLLSQGADVSIRNEEGKTALDIAEENGNKEIIKLFEDDN